MNSMYTHVELPAKREAIRKLEQWVNQQRTQLNFQGNNDGVQQGYRYDAENRMTTVLAPSGNDSYAYDPSNLRVYKVEPSGKEWIFFYGPGGELLVPYFWAGGTWGSNTTYHYFAGRLVGTEQDRVGSVVPAGNGYYPYGEQYTTTTQDTFAFATYYRDQTSGLDYAKNRYYSNTIGRFLTPDPSKSGNPADPGTWNRYAYSLNDPVNFGDPSGLDNCYEGPGPCVEPWTPVNYGNPLPKVKSGKPPKSSFPKCNPTGDAAEEARLAWIAENLGAADEAGAPYDIPADWVLGWAAEETGYGQNQVQALKQNNFFNESLPTGGITGGWLGAIPCSSVPGAAPGWACFPDFFVSAEAALNKAGPVLDQLIAAHPGWSEAQVFQAMNGIVGWNQGGDAAQYGQKIQNVTQGVNGNGKSLDSRIKCLETNHYVETPSGN